MFKDKAYVCNLCRKVITYSLDEAGKTMSCPFCKTAVTLPVGTIRQVPPPESSKALFIWIALAVLLLTAGAVGVYVITRPALPPPPVPVPTTLVAATPGTLTDRVSGLIPPWIKPRTDVNVTVSEVRFARPNLYDTALKRTVQPQTPVCCVKLKLTNNGGTSVSLKPWRMPDAFNDPKHASLRQKSDGRPYSLVSFGLDSYPADIQAVTELAPGETTTEVLFFFSKACPEQELELTLPCENLGGRGSLRIPISVGMITDAKEE